MLLVALRLVDAAQQNLFLRYVACVRRKPVGPGVVQW